MTQIFIFGGSIPHGVGAPQGWADLLKQQVYTQQYGPNGTGEGDQFYNFAKPGATAEFVLANAANQLRTYRNQVKGQAIAILSSGMNNAKAVETPTNYVSEAEDFTQTVRALLQQLKAEAEHVYVLGFSPIDAAKTNPKHNPLTGGKSYFVPERLALFEDILRQESHTAGVHFVELTNLPTDWVETCLAPDGLHPNQKGHNFLFEQLEQELATFF